MDISKKTIVRAHLSIFFTHTQCKHTILSKFWENVNYSSARFMMAFYSQESLQGVHKLFLISHNYFQWANAKSKCSLILIYNVNIIIMMVYQNCVHLLELCKFLALYSQRVFEGVQKAYSWLQMLTPIMLK